jgi:histidine triad (HIT) family protein
VPGCVFCDIVSRKIPSKLIHEDPLAIVLHDIHPRAPIHFLVIPREHIADLDAATPEKKPLLGHLLMVAKEVARAQGLKNGYRVVINRGADGGQSVDHLHVHVLGGRTLSWPPG